MPQSLGPSGAQRRVDDEAGSLEAFHAGSREAMTRFYEEHFVTVERAVGRVLRGADQETMVHEVFLRVLTSPELRASYRGGSLAAWIATVARNAAVDAWRRRQREQPSGPGDQVAPSTHVTSSFEASVEARDLLQRFREEKLPEKWRAVFDARFLMQLNQVEAAQRLGMQRTTLIYQEFRVRQLLRKFLLGTEAE